MGSNRDIVVVKRNGSKEPLNIEKIHKVLFWATEGLSGVSVSDIEMTSQIQFYNNIKTSDIQETLIKAAADLISEDAPNYQYVAGRLINYHLRKEVYDQYQPWHILDLIKKNVKAGFYDAELLTKYSEEEWDQINNYIDHERDMNLVYAAMEQMRRKYLVQNRVTKQKMETPQMLYALVAAVLFGDEPTEIRMNRVREYYEYTSKHYISLPTPIMAGVRTPQRQFSSCTLIETADDRKSITATSNAIVEYASQKAGIGIGAGRLRALGSPVRKGDTSHTGVTSFLRYFQSSIKSISQGSLRSSSGNICLVIWHLEVEDMLVLKNNKGTEETRVRHVDYTFQFSKLFYERIINGQNITLFCPNDVPEMYEAFFNDQEKFKKLYEAAEKNPKLRKKTIRGMDLFASFVQERKDTGRLYLMNVDHCNTHGSYIETIAPIHQTNLCVEITEHTKPLYHINDGATNLRVKHQIENHDAFNQYKKNNRGIFYRESLDNIISIVPDDGLEDHTQFRYSNELVEDEYPAEIALCTLSAINWGLINKPSDFEIPCRLAVRALDNLLDYQDYPVLAAQISTMNRRNLGIGIINYAYWLAKNGLKYSDDSALLLTEEYMEAMSFYIIKASVELAKEKGPCKRWKETKFSLGFFPWETRKPEVDELVPHVLRMSWEELRSDMLQYGIRNSNHIALMPAECEKYSNKLALADGTTPNYHELFDQLGINYESIEESCIPQRYAFPQPIMIKTANGDKPVYEYYYNGVQETYEIEFEDGEIYNFTGNHPLLVNRDGINQWIEVQYINESDEIVAIK